MSRFILPSGLAVIFGLALFACEGSEGESCNADEMTRADTILTLTPDEAAGSDTFADSCGVSSCHGADGDAGPGPNLSGEISGFSDDDLTCLLLTGTGGMPSQASLSDQELADVLAYVQTTF